MNADNIKINTHSSIKIEGTKTIYFDPWQIKDSSFDADIIFLTHDHFDHFSPEDIKKIKKAETKIVAPLSTKENVSKDSGVAIENLIFLSPDESLDLDGIKIQAIPAYNPNKKFHPRENNWLGYLVEMDGIKYLVTGDTDATDELLKVKCDISLTPIGGTYTMTAKEAAEAVCIISPKLAIPTHYGNIVGEMEDGEIFKSILEKAGISVELKI